MVAAFAIFLTGGAALLLPSASIPRTSVAALHVQRHALPRMADEPEVATAESTAAAAAPESPAPAKFDLKSVAKEESKKGAGL